MATCVGPPDAIAKGSPTVLIGNLMAARMGDLTTHGGVIVVGIPTVMVGEVGAGSPVVVAPMEPNLPGPASVAQQITTMIEAAVAGAANVLLCP
jgi:hypothetical protein